MAFPLVPGRGVGITMAPLQQVKLALANYLAVRGSHSGESVMCSSFVRIEGRCRTRRHPPGVILKSSVSPSVSYFTVARPRTAHALPHSRLPPASATPPAGCSRPLPGSNTSSNASTRLLAPGGDSIISLVRSFSPLGSLPACRVIPVALCPSTAVEGGIVLGN